MEDKSKSTCRRVNIDDKAQVFSSSKKSEIASSKNKREQEDTQTDMELLGLGSSYKAFLRHMESFQNLF